MQIKNKITKIIFSSSNTIFYFLFLISLTIRIIIVSHPNITTNLIILSPVIGDDFDCILVVFSFNFIELTEFDKFFAKFLLRFYYFLPQKQQKFKKTAPHRHVFLQQKKQSFRFAFGAP